MTRKLAREVTHVNPKFGRRSWVKLWVNEWLDGTTRFEMTDVQRAFWIDLLAMAGRSRFPGRICAGDTPHGGFVGYPLNKFQSLMAEPIDVEQTLALFERTGKVKLTVTSEEPTKLVMIELLNWDKYQSEYQRQKPYRDARAGLQASDQRSYTQGDNTDTEVEGEGEGDKKENERTTLSPASRSTPSDFDILWKLYPIRDGKKAAAKSFAASVKTDTDLAEIRKALGNYLASGNVKRGFVKIGSTWFANWRDWVDPSPAMMEGNGSNGDTNGRQGQQQPAPPTHRNDDNWGCDTPIGYKRKPRRE